MSADKEDERGSWVQPTLRMQMGCGVREHVVRHYYTGGKIGRLEQFLLPAGGKVRLG
jgi:hypothetical protein